MWLGEVLHEPKGELTHVYFPTSSIVSLLYVMENGDSSEVAVIGNEGMVGVSLFMGGDTTPNRAVVQRAGHGFRMKAQFLRQDFNLLPSVRHQMLRFTQALITQMAQTAVSDCRP